MIDNSTVPDVEKLTDLLMYKISPNSDIADYSRVSKESFDSARAYYQMLAEGIIANMKDWLVIENEN